MLKTCKALGIFLRYPDTDWAEHAIDLCDLIEAEGRIKPAQMRGLKHLAQNVTTDLFDAQETYVATFDRVRSLSLHLFEHVHGESRDRGQAMIDLIELYEAKGLMPPTNELPDYLPMFLEYLSHTQEGEAHESLKDIAHILEAISRRLKDRQSPYGAVFDALLTLAGQRAVAGNHTLIGGKPEEASSKELDADFTDIDSLWEDPMVDFLGAKAPQSGAACG
ncbi:MAG: nitrate reductase molybdenum cofactor assembly chaperone [Asticcacaulis sp.]